MLNESQLGVKEFFTMLVLCTTVLDILPSVISEQWESFTQFTKLKRQTTFNLLMMNDVLSQDAYSITQTLYIY